MISFKGSSIVSVVFWPFVLQLLAIFLVLLLPVRCIAQTISPSDATQTHISHIEHGLVPTAITRNKPVPHFDLLSRMQHYRVPAVSIVFFDHGDIIWARAYGLADVENKRPVTPDTLFQAASISKPIFATAVLQSVQRGELSLDAPINTYLRSWKLPKSGLTAQEQVTLRRILSHSAGLSVHGFEGYPSNATKLPTMQQILNGEPPANNAPVKVETIPGTETNYSGGGYVVAAVALSDTLQQSVGQILQERVLAPVGMSRSTMQQPLPTNMLRQAALPYQSDGSPVPDGPRLYPEEAPDGLWSTPSDLARFAIAIQKAYAGTSTVLLSEATAHLMLTAEKEEYGLGFQLGSSAGRPSFSHNGANVGYICTLFAYRDMGQGMAVMINSENGGPLLREIQYAISLEYNWPDFKPGIHDSVVWPTSTLQKLTGQYKFESDDLGSVTISVKDGNAVVIAPGIGSAPMELVPETATSFFLPDTNSVFRFSSTGDGTIQALTLSAYGENFVAKRVP